MPRRTELKPHLTTAELYRRYRQCREPQEKARWRALHLISQGTRAADASRRVGRTSGWVTQLTQRYNERGAEAVATKQGAVKPDPRPSLNAQRPSNSTRLYGAPRLPTAGCGQHRRWRAGLRSARVRAST